ncbi:MAG: Glycosyltransferase AglD [Methanoregula sp. PtaU1.Bin051]|nr:MAG: Glycosyltransferase AglD [Methanoregula sp. PtaU1.Bin051]
MYRKIAAIVLPTLFAAIILGWMLFSIWGQLLEAFAHIVPQYLALAVIICSAGWVIRGWRYQTILVSMDNKVSLRTSTGCILVSQTVNLVVPFRIGDFVRIFILNHEYDTRYSDGVSSIVVERVFDVATVALLGLAALPFVIGADPSYFTVIVAVLGLCAAFFVFLLFAGRFRSENKYIRIILSMLHEIRRASLSFRSVIVLGCSSVVIWLFDIFACISVVMMFKQEVSFATVVFAIVVGNLIKAVPITPGGLGTYEFLVARTFALAGMQEPYANLIAIIDHLIKNLVTLAGGIISMYFFGDWVMPTIKKVFRTRLDGGTDSGP